MQENPKSEIRNPKQPEPAESPSPPAAASEPQVIPFGSPNPPNDLEATIVAPEACCPPDRVILRRADGSERVLEGVDAEALISVTVKNPRILAAIDQVPDSFLVALEAAVLSGRWFGSLSWHSAPQPPDDLQHTWTNHRYDPRDVVPSLRQVSRDFVTKQAAKITKEADLPWS